jgi:hypothetical protein
MINTRSTQEEVLSYDNEHVYAVDLVVINPALRYGEFSWYRLRFINFILFLVRLFFVSQKKGGGAADAR